MVPSSLAGEAGEGGARGGAEDFDGDERGAYLPGSGAADPRIGRPDRTGTLAVGGLFVVALAAALPVVALLVVLAWSLLARTADRSMTSIVLRRFHYGSRRGDVPVTVALGPWHLLTGSLAAAVGLLLPLLVGIAGVFCVALALSATTASSPNPNHPIALGGGMALALLMAWWGPGGASLRQGVPVGDAWRRARGPGDECRQRVVRRRRARRAGVAGAARWVALVGADVWTTGVLLVLALR